MNSAEDKVVYGSRLKLVRKALEMNQEAMGQFFSLSQGNYSAYERGRLTISLEMLAQLYEAHRVNPLFVVNGELPMLLEPDHPGSGQEEASTVRGLPWLHNMGQRLHQANAGELATMLKDVTDYVTELLASYDDVRGRHMELSEGWARLAETLIEIQDKYEPVLPPPPGLARKRPS